MGEGETTYTADDYRRMLVAMIDANCGDGVPEVEANELREFWEAYLEDVIRKHEERVAS